MTLLVLHLYATQKKVSKIFLDILLDIFVIHIFFRRFRWEATAMEVELWLS
jgi:hypothetical protein